MATPSTVMASAELWLMLIIRLPACSVTEPSGAAAANVPLAATGLSRNELVVITANPVVAGSPSAAQVAASFAHTPM